MGNKPSSTLLNAINQAPLPPPVRAALSDQPPAPPTPPPQPTGPPPGYLGSMDQGSWDIYNQLETTQAMNGLKLDPYNSFCNSYTSSDDLNKQCNNLTEFNCKQVGCCVDPMVQPILPI